MKIAVVIGNASVFPSHPEGHKLRSYGGFSRFYEGLAYGFPPEVEFYMIGVDVSPGNFVKNVIPVKCSPKASRKIYLNRALRVLRELKPDFVIIQNPTLVLDEVASEFRHVCRVGGYMYQGHLKHHINYVTISNWGNIHYGMKWPVIYQTCSPLDVEYQEEKEDYLLFVSNLTRAFGEKGLEYACKFADEQKIKLIVAGPVGDKPKLLNRMKSLESEFVKYIGPISGQKKVDMISRARSIFYPIDKSCKEMGGTIIVEASFCGTPVIATNTGSIPEYINHGVSGFVCNNDKDYIRAVKNIDSISPKDCLDWAKKKFDQKLIASQYLGLARKKL